MRMMQAGMRASLMRGSFVKAGFFSALVLIAAPSVQAADDAASTNKTMESIQEAGRKTSESVQEMGRKTTEAVGTLGQKVSENRLANRTCDEMVAWVLIGVLVGSVAGMATSIKCSGLGKLGRIGLGLVGAFIGSMVVRVSEIDLGWGEAVLSYEEMLFSLVAAVGVVVIARLVRMGMRRRKKSS